MKILYHHRVRSKDGQAVHIDELIAALRRRGHEVIVVAPPSNDGERFGSSGGWTATLKRRLPGWLYEALELGYSLVAYWRLARAWRRHRPDALYERYNLYLLAGVWLRKRTGLPMILEVNAPLADERRANGELALPRLGRWAEHSVWRAASVVAPVTRALAAYVMAAGVPEARITVIPNGIDPDHFAGPFRVAEVRTRYGLDDRVVLGFTGFMRPWHGIDRIIRFVAAHSELPVHALLAGDGPARLELEALARALGVAHRVTFAGLIGRAEIAHVVATFDVALQPDVVPYASPLKLFEYMVLGRAIVAPGRPNIREILTDGTDALLFDPDTPEGFETALLRLCHDGALRDRLGQGARATIDGRGLTWDRNAERVERLFRDLLERSG